MDLGIKEAQSASYDEVEMDLEAILAPDDDFDDVMTDILANGTTVTDSESLKRQAESLRSDLREKMSVGLGDDAVRIRRLIAETEDRISAATITELRAGITRATDRLAEIVAEIEYVQSVKMENVETLDQRVAEMEAANLIVHKNNLAIEILRTEAESMRVSRRECRQRLQELIDESMEEK